MLRLKVRGVAIDPSGNEREVWVELDVSGQSSLGGTVMCSLYTGGQFTVEAEPGKFNPWGPAAQFTSEGQEKR